MQTPHGIEIPVSKEFSRPWLLRKISRGRYEKEEIAGALALVNSDDSVLECGAGLGVLGTTVARLRRPRKMVSFEANPGLIPVIQAAYERNQVSDIISVKHGVVLSGPALPRMVEFNIASRFAFSSLGTPQRELAETVSVPVHDFASVRIKLRPTVLLMDIEGGEHDFLGAADLAGINSIVVEFHPDIYGSEGMEFCKSTLREAGFAPEAEISTDTVWAAKRTR